MPIATLVLVIRQSPTPAVPLGYKKKGFGQGKYTRFGGKVQAGERFRARFIFKPDSTILDHFEFQPE